MNSHPRPMPLLIHAQVTVTGKPEALAPFRDEMNRLLFENETEVTEHHRESELVYDLKVMGGIPFPAFVAASAAHPEFKVTIEWVNAQAAVKGFATIENQTHFRPGNEYRCVAERENNRHGAQIQFARVAADDDSAV